MSFHAVYAVLLLLSPSFHALLSCFRRLVVSLIIYMSCTLGPNFHLTLSALTLE